MCPSVHERNHRNRPLAVTLPYHVQHRACLLYRGTTYWHTVPYRIPEDTQDVRRVRMISGGVPNSSSVPVLQTGSICPT